MRLVVGRPSSASPSRYNTRHASGNPVDSKAKFDLYETPTERTDNEAHAFERTRSRIMAYDIFPPRFVRSALYPPAPIQIGTIIVQWAGFGVIWIEAAVRVTDVWEREESSGFAYETLEGHPESGVATFAVERRRDETWIKLTARSKPGTFLTRLGRPVARFAQRKLTRMALARLASPTS
jgi:uncharacterized protein (UPF0548 family)